MFFCPYYLKNVILFLDEPSGIAESYVFNPVLCLYHLKVEPRSSVSPNSYIAINVFFLE